VFTTREILYTAAVPFGVTLVVLLAAWRPWRRRERSVARGWWAGAAGIGVGFFLAFALLDGRPPAWPPAEARHGLFYFVAALTVLGVVEGTLHAWAPGAAWLRAEAALVVFAAGLFLLFQSKLRNDSWTPLDAACHLLGMTVLTHAAWASTEVLVLRLPRPAGPLVLATFSGAVAVVVMLSGSMVYGRLAGAIAVAVLAAALVAPAAPRLSVARGGVTVVVPATLAILLLARYYVEPGVTVKNGALLLASLVLPWAVTIRPLRRRRPWVRTMIAVVLAVVPAGVAAVLAYRTFARMEKETGSGDEPAAYSFHVSSSDAR
jgi:hypothetical protein